ncbi:hypothetical protein AGMMS50267_15610 [Spirochaetia bacterium]|nr:hypothetical protein AGMMS50267_15610 [Spirochaetia bacterium]
MTQRYYIKCEADRVEYLDILDETSEGYTVRVTRIKDGYEKNIEDFMSRELFELCLKTRYISAGESVMSSVA